MMNKRLVARELIRIAKMLRAKVLRRDDYSKEGIDFFKEYFVKNKKIEENKKYSDGYANLFADVHTIDQSTIPPDPKFFVEAKIFSIDDARKFIKDCENTVNWLEKQLKVETEAWEKIPFEE